MTSYESPIELYQNELYEGAKIFRAISHPLRQKILQLIHTKGKITVTELYHILHLEQSVTSQHLAVLRRTGFVNTERKERFIFYSLSYDRLNEVQQLGNQLIKF